ncbi:hypothetical protein M413DRAFT_21015 [Hebeloma cylindrosporum]|uniref:Mid2 domain-containing protein n=1 Tax=Hebeloma cylindrosporum TaxID=76867 RepID=A0A0C3CX00_HEBCY|nr:hypothetical protein M413DRAFT_21015 [Hebeloma cylindrosporum h7]
MADTCVPTPTQTRTDVGTSQSQVTTFSVSTSTAPGSVETTVFRTCSANAPSGVTSTCIPTVTTSYITHPGNTSVVTVPVTVGVDYPVTNIVTLWGSSCSSVYSPPPYTPPTDSTTSSTSTSWSIYTPPPTIITSSTTMTSDGSTFVDYFTSTSTSAATSVAVQTTGAADTGGVHHKKANNVGPIVGGVVGGIVALLLLGFITWKLINKQPRFDDIFNNDQHHNKITKDPDPKPYGYDPVGQQAMDATSPQMNPQGLEGHGLDQGFNDVGTQPSQAPPHHIRNPSLTPLLAAVGVAAVGAGAASLSTSSRPTSSRPSTSDSHPIGPMVTQTGQGVGQGYPPSSYPPALQNWGPNQGYGAANTQGGYTPQGLASGSGQASGSVPTSSLAPNTSVGSTGSVPSTTSSWGAPSGAGSSSGPHMPPLIPIIAGGVRNNRQQQYEDPFNRTGSPVSIQEQRILQVTNADSSPYPGGSVYDPNAYYAEGSSSSSAYYAEGSSSGAGPSSSSAAASNSSAFAAADGKGRPLNTRGEKAPIVHLDGGLYQQPVPGVQTGPAPPAYTE